MKINTYCSVLAMMLALTACGGSSGGGTPDPEPPVVDNPDPTPEPEIILTEFSGTAAVGAAITDGQVEARCADGSGFVAGEGADAVVITSSLGTYSGYVAADALPCALQVSGGNPDVTLHGFISEANGTANITPLTDMIIAAASSMIPEDWFGSDNWDLIEADLDVVTSEVLTRLTDAGYKIPEGNGSPLSVVFEIGDQWDQVLDDIAENISDDPSLENYSSLVQLLADGNLSSIPDQPPMASMCFNADLHKPGAQFETVTETWLEDMEEWLANTSITRVTDGATFEGKNVLMRVVESSRRSVSDWMAEDWSTTAAYVSLDTITTYFDVDADTPLVNTYGRDSHFTTSDEKVDGSMTIIYESESQTTFRDSYINRYDLREGESYEIEYTSEFESELESGEYSYSEIIKFDSLETLSIGENSYQACVMEFRSSNDSNSLTRQWIGVGNGLVLKTESYSDDVVTHQSRLISSDVLNAE